MRLSQRAFPHPVVGNADDVVDVAFQTPIDFTHDSANYYISAQVQCSSKTIAQLVKHGQAAYVLHVECSNTLYRNIFEFTTPEFEVRIPSELLNATVEVNLFVVAKQDLPKYKVDKAHPDYGDASFSVSAGEVLAIGEACTFEADIDFDALRSVGSILQIRELPGPEHAEMQFDFSGEKISIFLSPHDFGIYKILKTHQPLCASVVPPIVVAAVARALDVLKNGQAEEDLRWARCLRKRLDHLDLTLEGDSLELAQKVLELPIKRSFITAKGFLEGLGA
jgi:hypothetical protein